MSEDESLSDVLKEFRGGDEQAFEELWARTKEKILKAARKKLDTLGVRGASSEDIADEVFFSLWRGAKGGRFPRLDATKDLWQVVHMLIRQKVVDWRRRQRPEHTESALGHAAGDSSDMPGMGNVHGEELPPDVIVEVADCLRNYLDTLDETKRLIVVYHLDGLSNPEIAEKTGWSLRSVERKIPLLKDRMLEALLGPEKFSAS